MYLNLTRSSSLYKEQAHALLQQGISSSNQAKALEALLAIVSDYRSGAAANLPLWFKALFFGGALVCAVLSIRPKAELGLGAGRARIERWKAWLTLVFVSVPAFIFSLFGPPLLQRLFPSLFAR